MMIRCLKITKEEIKKDVGEVLRVFTIHTDDSKNLYIGFLRSDNTSPTKEEITRHGTRVGYFFEHGGIGEFVEIEEEVMKEMYEWDGQE